MRNFLGRLLILIASSINVVLFVILLCSLVFDLVTRGEEFDVAYNGVNNVLNIFDASLFFLYIIAFVWVTILCIKNIVAARSMRHTLLGTIILLIIEIIYFFYHIFTPGVLVTNLGLFIGVNATAMLTTLCLIAGCTANFFKDCVN